MYWDSKLETINREELEALQFKRLIKTLKTVTRNVNFYKEKFKAAGVSLKDIKTLADVKKLPFTTGEDLKATYPDGLLAIKKEAVIRLHTSSGTTGKPKAIFFSAKDIDNAA
ncbi:MAG TPA: phenylacetate--CoA ligase, partial [Verrucomicrobiota bacterium]|nr:phenylacetate--CoA ligase [Verrucomicrobiota bacterium]